MRRVMLAAVLLTPITAWGEQPTPMDVQQASAATLADLGSLVVSLRAQLLADQRQITDLGKQLETVKSAPKETPHQ